MQAHPVQVGPEQDSRHTPGWWGVAPERVRTAATPATPGCQPRLKDTQGAALVMHTRKHSLQCKDDTANNKHVIWRRERDAPRHGRALASEGRGALGHSCTSLPRQAFAAPALAPKPLSWHPGGPSASRRAPCPPFPHVNSWVWTPLCMRFPCHTTPQQVQARLFCPRHLHAHAACTHGTWLTRCCFISHVRWWYVYDT